MSIYTDNGYKDRKHYLESVAEEYNTPVDVVIVTADLLGEEEDFDGLISIIQDYDGLYN